MNARSASRSRRMRGIDLPRRRRASGFTLVELLVVIAVIGLLITMVISISSRVFYAQRRASTEATMRTLSLSIEQFAQEDPMRILYNSRGSNGLRGGATFGPYPPYRLEDAAADSASPPQKTLVTNIVENPDARPGGLRDAEVAQRFARDFSVSDFTDENYINIHSLGDGNDDDDEHSDNRSLAAYLEVYANGRLSSLTGSMRKPLPGAAPEGEYITIPSVPDTPANRIKGRRPILGFYDAWGVPFDYYLYVRIETDDDGTLRVRERVPVLMSRGVSLDEFKALRKDLKRREDPGNWMVSAPFPSPVAMKRPGEANNVNQAFWRRGDLNDDELTGWVRAVGFGENYGYVASNDYDGNSAVRAPAVFSP